MDLGAQVGDKLSGVVAGVVADNCRELAKGASEGLNGDGLLALECPREIIDGE